MVDPVYVVLGDAIRRRRDALGMTQATLANHLQLSRTSVTNIERGRQPMLVHQLYRAANALGVEVFDLLPSKAASKEVAAADLPVEFQSLLTKLRTPLPETPQ